MKGLIFNKDNLTRFLIMLAAISAGYLVLHHDTPKSNENVIHEANFSEIQYIDEDTTSNVYKHTK